MSLVVWLPLTKDLRQQGVSSVIATNSGATYSSTGGKLGGCYTIAPTSGITLPASAMTSFTTGCSVVFWIKINSWKSSYDTYFQAGLNSTPWAHYRFGILRYNTGSNLCFTITNSSGNSSCASYVTSNLETGVWYHLAFTYTTGKVRCYINGVLDKEYTTTIVPDFAGITNISIGRCTNGSSYPTDCNMNDFRIYDHCLSPMEVKQISQGLTLHYSLTGINNTKVPFGFQELEYIESNGSSYFNTGYKFNPEIDACKVEFKGNDVSNTGMIFADSGGKYFWFYYYGTSGIRVYADNGTGQQGIAGIPSDLNKHVMEYKNKHYYIDGVDKGSLSKTYTEDTNTIWLFSYGGNSYPFKGRIYYTNILRNNNIQRVYIPAKRVSDSAIGMYELITNQFFTSASSAFIAGPVVGIPSIIYDISGFCYNGNISGNLTISNDTPKYQTSLYMPKTTTITHPRPVFGGIDQEWTCAMWVKLDDLSGSQMLNNFNRGNYLTTGTNALLYLNDGTNDYYNYSNTKLTAGVWIHVVFVFKNSNIIKRIYFNGVDKTNTSGPNKTSTPAGIADTITVGTNLSGYISDYRVYATALSADDVKSLYQNSAYIDSSGNIYGAVHTEV